MTQREEFETFCASVGFAHISLLFNGKRYADNAIDNMWRTWQAAKAVVPEGWKLVPMEPTTEQYGGLARDIIQWMRFTPSSNQHSESLIEWLKNMGNEIPSWLMGENEINHLSRHVLSKGTIAAIIYKAMLAAAPEQQE